MENIEKTASKTAASINGRKEITILATNDIHGRFLGEGDAIDFSRLATLRKEHKDDWLLVDAGDATQGTPFAIMKKGLYPIEIMNEVGYDILTIGNHEFDNITKDVPECELDQIINKFKNSYIAANVKNKKTGENYIQSVRGCEGRYVVKTIQGFHLLFIGVATPEMSMDIERMEDFTIEDMNNIVGSAQSIITEIKEKQPIHAVVALSHLGSKGGVTSAHLAKRVPEFNLIIDGHSHQKISQTVNDILITQADCYGNLVAKITLTFENDKLVKKQCEFLDKKALQRYKQDITVKDKLDQLRKELDGAFGKRCAAFSSHTLWGGAIPEDRPYVLKAVNISRYAQTNMGDATTQGMTERVRDRWSELNENVQLEKDKIKEDEYIISAINGGGLRDSIPYGKEIRNYELFSVLPSHLHSAKESGFSMFRIKISDLKAILENSVSKILYRDNKLQTSDGRFLNLSGIRYTIKRNGQSLQIDNTAVLYDALDPAQPAKTVDFTKDGEKTVLFCTSKYIAGGGDGYTILRDKNKLAGCDDALFQIVGEFIRNQCKGKEFDFKMVSDNITYEGFDFKENNQYTVTLTNRKGEPQCNQVVIYCFSSVKGKDYKIVFSDEKGKIKIQPPKGNSILQIMLLLPFNNKERGQNLYGELYLHTYYSLQEGACLTACLEADDKIRFPEKPLAVFRHKFNDSKKEHYSNYLNFINHLGNKRTFLIFGGELYTTDIDKYKYSGDPAIEFEKTTGITYQINAMEMEYFSFNMFYETWGGKMCDSKIFLV